ncbi:Sec1-like protein [Neoconidiobolus thromboides FSU 785]|nr:Sec1-like protein [Neoconidiobolus thromboides FSU 785]
MVSFQEIFREKFLTNVRSVSQDGEWKVVIMDAMSYKIYSIVCEDSDLLNLNVKAIEMIHTPRPKSQNDVAVYFILPTKQNIDYLLSDFQDSRNRRYKEAHLFFLAPVKQSEFKRLSSNVSKYWKSLKELYIDYMPFESKTFSLNMEDSFYCLYAGNKTLFESEILKISKKLLSIVLTLEEIPIIRYQSMVEGSLNVAQNLATNFQQCIDNYLLENPELAATTMENSNNQQRPIWLFLDRSTDLLAPIMHSITYQALVNDFLPLKDGRVHEHTFINGHGEEKKEEVILSDSDNLWNELKHHHIADVSDYLLKKLKELSNNNAAAANLMGRNNESSENKLPSVKEMRDIVSAVPELQMLAKQYSVHINLANKCLDIISNGLVEKCILAEQDLAMNIDSEGNTITNPLAIIAPLLNSLQVPIRAKLRLIICYLLYFDRHSTNDYLPSESSLRKLINHAGLSDYDRMAVTNITHLLNNKPLKAPKVTTSYIYSLFWNNKSENEKEEKEEEEEELYALSRYKCEISKVLTLACKKRLNPMEFPFTNEEDKLELINQLSAKKGLRVSQPKWQKKKKRIQSKSNTLNNATSNGIQDNTNSTTKDKSIPFGMDTFEEDALSIYNNNNGKIIIFMAGGITYTEIKEAYDISKKYKQEILIGSTHISTPTLYLDQLKNMLSFDFNTIEIELADEQSDTILPSPSPSPQKDNNIINNSNVPQMPSTTPPKIGTNEPITITSNLNDVARPSSQYTINTSNQPNMPPILPKRPSSQYSNNSMNNSMNNSINNSINNDNNNSRPQSQYTINNSNQPNMPPVLPSRPQSQLSNKEESITPSRTSSNSSNNSQSINYLPSTPSRYSTNDNNNTRSILQENIKNNEENNNIPLPASITMPMPLPNHRSNNSLNKLKPKSNYSNNSNQPSISVEHLLDQNNNNNTKQKSELRSISSQEIKKNPINPLRQSSMDMSRGYSAPGDTLNNNSNSYLNKKELRKSNPILSPLMMGGVPLMMFNNNSSNNNNTIDGFNPTMMPDPSQFQVISPISATGGSFDGEEKRKEKKEKEDSLRRDSTLRRKGGVRKSTMK